MIDFSALISQLLSTYWWLVPLLIVAALFKSAKQDLTPILPISRYKILPQMRQRHGAAHQQKRPQCWQSILGLLRISQVSDDCDSGMTIYPAEDRAKEVANCVHLWKREASPLSSVPFIPELRTPFSTIMGSAPLTSQTEVDS